MDNSTETTQMEDDYFSDFAYFSNAKYAALLAAGVFSSTLSIAGSCTILYLISRGNKTRDIYQRLVLGLSISDLFVTITLLLQPILTPKETEYPFSVGNQTTCNFIGFGFLFFVSSYSYNCMLGIYFLAVVRYGASSALVSRYMEPWGHFIAFSVPIAIGISAVRYDLLNVNPFLGACALFPTDHECTWNDDIECENPIAHNVLNSILDYYAMVTAGVGLICTVLVWCTVRKRFKVDLEAENSNSGDVAPERIVQAKRIRSIAVQAVFYTAAYLVGLFCVVAANTLEGVYNDGSLETLGNEPVYFFITLLLWFFFPLQGFFNCLVYIRPRLVRWKAYYGEKSWWYAFQQALSLEKPPSWGTSDNQNHATHKTSTKNGKAVEWSEDLSNDESVQHHPRIQDVRSKNTKHVEWGIASSDAESMSSLKRFHQARSKGVTPIVGSNGLSDEGSSGSLKRFQETRAKNAKPVIWSIDESNDRSIEMLKRFQDAISKNATNSGESRDASLRAGKCETAIRIYDAIQQNTREPSYRLPERQIPLGAKGQNQGKSIRIDSERCVKIT